MDTAYPTSMFGRDHLTQYRAAELNGGSYNLWFGSLQEAPFYAELYRAAQLHEQYENERSAHRSRPRLAARPLCRLVGAEARRLWNHLFHPRNN